MTAFLTLHTESFSSDFTKIMKHLMTGPKGNSKFCFPVLGPTSRADGRNFLVSACL